MRFQPLPSPFYVGQQYDVAVVLEDMLGHVPPPTTVALSFEYNDWGPHLDGTLQATSDAGVAHFKVRIAGTARQLSLRATLPGGFSAGSDPFDVVLAPTPLPASDGPWTPAGPGGGPVNVVAIAPDDPAVVFAATNRALFRSGDGGTSWTAAPTGGVEALSTDRQRAQSSSAPPPACTEPSTTV